MSQPSVTFHTVVRDIAGHRPRKVPFRRYATRCAVAVVMRGHPEFGVQFLMMRRAERAGDPWSGHMSFPGGRYQSSDAHLFETAVRECEEEVGVDLKKQARTVGRLSDVVTRKHEAPRPMIVTPFVFELDVHAKLVTNHEAQEALWIPLDFVLEPGNRTTMRWNVGPARLSLPCYFYEGRRLWGLSLLMIDELTRVVGGPDFRRRLWRRRWLR